ncbi:hypothetical protein BCR42DRAFT_213784 [Absidia repens]|uniref:Uncharacterized protein n=1 Tax=Absidia repens TaxID=90262 RepID=A0A1X2HKG4_9FUNG|nr:hypothetical protein BCR42DRAFT_213784 [Absidia repens]
MLSVKLKLFEIMDTKDKLNLLFLAGCEPVTLTLAASVSYVDHILPTFATSTISKSTYNLFAPDYPLNFDLVNKSTITLRHHARDAHLYYFLQLTPKKYYVLRKPYDGHFTQKYVEPKKKRLCNGLHLDEGSLAIDIVCLTYFDENTLESCTERAASDNCKLWLFGSFGENKWVISMEGHISPFEQWDHHDNDDNGTVFNIY